METLDVRIKLLNREAGLRLHHTGTAKEVRSPREFDHISAVFLHQLITTTATYPESGRRQLIPPYVANRLLAYRLLESKNLKRNLRRRPFAYYDIRKMNEVKPPKVAAKGDEHLLSNLQWYARHTDATLFTIALK
ncbi:MAG TPA: hypothetical protein VF597_00630 [Candidatus Saccharimonadales bacterium]|jgi:hypothetical protein